MQTLIPNGSRGIVFLNSSAARRQTILAATLRKNRFLDCSQGRGTPQGSSKRNRKRPAMIKSRRSAGSNFASLQVRIFSGAGVDDDPSRPEATIADREIAGICGAPPAALRNRPLSAQAVLRSLGDFDFRPMLAKLRVPVLVVEGEKRTSRDATQEWVKATPGARL